MAKNTLASRPSVEELKEAFNQVSEPTLAYFFLNFETHSLEFSHHILNFLPLESLFFEHYILFFNLLAVEDTLRIQQALRCVIRNKDVPQQLEFKIQHPLRTPLWLRCTAKRVDKGITTRDFIVGVLEEVTDEVNHRLIIDSCLDGTYIGDFDRDVSFFSGKLFEQLSLQSGLQKNVTQNYRKMLVPEDIPHYDRYLSHMLDNYSTQKSQKSCIEYRVYDKEGNVVWLSNRNQVFYDAQNRARLVVGGYININEMHGYNRYVENRANRCDTTGLPDHYRFYTDLKQLGETGQNSAYVLFVYTDVKALSGHVGYDGSQLFLKNLSQILQDNASDNARLYRLDTDSFALLLQGATEHNATEQMQKYQLVTGAPFVFQDFRYDYNVSIAALLYRTENTQPDLFTQRGALALKKLRMDQKRQSVVFDDQALLNYQKKVILENKLFQSVGQEMSGFFMVYQPFIRAQDGRVVGVEALLRWRNSEGEIVSPAEFIPILENLGLMDTVGEWVFKTAASQCKEWLRKGFDRNFYVSVNATASQLAQESFGKMALRFLKKIDLSPHNVMIEMTESMMLLDARNRLQPVHSLKESGIRLAIDDFGTGYSSLSYLKDLPADKIKIDRSFIRDIEHDLYCKEFVSSIIKISQSIGRVVCVEGVELQHQADILAGMRADIFQGFLFSKPKESPELETFFLSNRRLCSLNPPHFRV